LAARGTHIRDKRKAYRWESGGKIDSRKTKT
jgi:hypothetical protein